jgi:L-galactose dehydrogenase
LQREGKVRNVGISGLPLKMLADVAVRAQVDTVLSYCRYNLLACDLDEWLTPVVQLRELGLINASPLHMGLLTGAGAPEWHPAPEMVKRAGGEVVRMCIEQGVDPAVVALAFCLAHPYVSSTLVGMSSCGEVEPNLLALEMEPNADLLAKIEQLVEPVKNMLWRSGRVENNDAEA